MSHHFTNDNDSWNKDLSNPRKKKETKEKRRMNDGITRIEAKKPLTQYDTNVLLMPSTMGNKALSSTVGQSYGVLRVRQVSHSANQGENSRDKAFL